ncbi:isocitrate lyase/phosphoenolpyruvate mutase family protein [Streptomyces sp. I4(2020)]|uniref:isocitrate lyase/phosphoenolpyruvate mutase family protein n=1 Tax=Streptomyces sp. I4(2020) TaxID=2760981 RepID=UPI0018EEAA37|nr:isocitrate lyase/phosphoenolpyruvate mutase family protein [Streptomyces sp. I4(2020)]MBJ6614133.1 isocitrate lyase/phosphoenolpyruvate mutase family protein [Streptomyces sp. I3(2020)]MBJ6624348.1 isocitrate lyase/phosphoenolpyruvate mutase family protein [Streptomyces sp. I4(2020)]
MTDHHAARPAETFAALHRQDRPLLLPNAWDHASAALLHAHGFPAVGTTSLGVAAAAGLPDGVRATREETLRLAGTLGALPFLNARTDTYWLGNGEGTRERVLAYRDAGADGVFVPGLTDLGAIAVFVRDLEECPLNVLYAPGGPSLARLGDHGVRRVSLGSLPYRRALGAALDAVVAVREGREAGEGTVPSYREVQELVG